MRRLSVFLHISVWNGNKKLFISLSIFFHHNCWSESVQKLNYDDKNLIHSFYILSCMKNSFKKLLSTLRMESYFLCGFARFSRRWETFPARNLNANFINIWHNFVYGCKVTQFSIKLTLLMNENLLFVG
jgi:hypothetical protein